MLIWVEERNWVKERNIDCTEYEKYIQNNKKSEVLEILNKENDMNCEEIAEEENKKAEKI